MVGELLVNSRLQIWFSLVFSVLLKIMNFLNSAKTKTVAFTAIFVGAATLASPALASADAVDDVLNALPSGEISCSQAERYWTNEADYNNKVTQANALALFDSRGPQIKAALARVDEAAVRCGLKGGTTANTGNTGGNTGGTAAAAPAINLAPAGTPSFTVQIPGIGGIQLPDLYKIVQQFLAQFGIHI